MKIIKRTIFVMFLALMLMSFTNIYLRMTSEEPLVIPKNDVVLVPIEIEKIPIEIDQTDKFLDAIGMRESSNRYDVVNGWGYMGKYQFGKRTLKALGYDVSKKEFLNSPYLQEKAMLDLLHHNRKILKTYIEYWDGKTIHGKRITESGILAAAHLAGPGNVKKFFRKGAEFKDGNGTKMTSYLTQFSGYKLNLD
jgi:hypothetical protein